MVILPMRQDSVLAWDSSLLLFSFSFFLLEIEVPWKWTASLNNFACQLHVHVCYNYVDWFYFRFYYLHYTGVCKTLGSMCDVTEVTEVTCTSLDHTHLVVCWACDWIAVSGTCSSPFSLFTAPSSLCKVYMYVPRLHRTMRILILLILKLDWQYWLTVEVCQWPSS